MHFSDISQETEEMKILKNHCLGPWDNTSYYASGYTQNTFVFCEETKGAIAKEKVGKGTTLMSICIYSQKDAFGGKNRS